MRVPIIGMLVSRARFVIPSLCPNKGNQYAAINGANAHPNQCFHAYLHVRLCSHSRRLEIILTHVAGLRSLSDKLLRTPCVDAPTVTVSLVALQLAVAQVLLLLDNKLLHLLRCLQCKETCALPLLIHTLLLLLLLLSKLW